MNRRILTVLLVFGAGLVSVRAAAPAPLPAAFFDIETSDPAVKESAAQAGALLGAYLGTQDSLMLVERQQLAAVLGEQSLDASGLVNPATAARVGQLTGAKVLLLSRAFPEGKNLMVVVKIIGAETGRTFAQVESIPPGEKRSEGLQSLAARIGDSVRKNAGELVAKAESADDRVARMQKQVAGRTLPAISISIPEQHISHRVVDPAAETEIANILGRAGFPLFQSPNADTVRYRITGEAFSEQGIRHGDFVSCRARVEIKVTEAATGRIVLQDRQTEVAADLAENVAAKTALQHAGAQLAERVFQQLAAAN
jgi:hypothetical protein